MDSWGFTSIFYKGWGLNGREEKITHTRGTHGISPLKENSPSSHKSLELVTVTEIKEVMKSE
jgi:hypothetical protein